MNAIQFDEANEMFVAPPGKEAEIFPLPVYKGPDEGGRPVVVSCWQPTEEEIQYILEHRKIWLWVWTHRQPPVIVEARYPFKNVEPNPDYVENEQGN